jgi:hypothetical protein
MRKLSIYATGKKLFFGVLLFLSVFIPHSTKAAGVTIITHGADGDVTGWVTEMANVIPTYYHNYRYPGLSTNFTVYTITLTTDGNGNYFYQCTNNSGIIPSNTDTGEIIVRLDWSQMAQLGSVYDTSTYTVGWVASYVIMQTNTISDLHGHALSEYPIHLIGHSRGGSLMSQISYVLGTNGIWVDHLTTLDPHPLNNDIFGPDGDFPITVVDAPVNTYANVLFHDNYWQDLGNGLTDPIGEPVAGAYVRQLYSLSGGYINDFFNIFDDTYQYHSNVHLWYDGTIDLNVPTSYNDDGSTITLDATMRTSWWLNSEGEGGIAGFYYSLIGGADRTSANMPLGLPGDPAIRDGYNQAWNVDLGAGMSNNRTSLPANNGTWPNIIKFDVTGTNTVLAGQQIATKFYFQYGGTSNTVTTQIYFDRDLNPYNTNSTLAIQGSVTNTGISSIRIITANLNSTNVPPGVYAIYAKMTDGVHTRYLYTPELVQILSNLQQPTLDIQKSGNTQFIIGINGVSGQKIILQASSSLQNWTSLATNTLTASRWTYTNSLPANMQFYRALLSQ